MADFPGLSHVAVTVTDLDASRDWYQRLFDVEPALDEDAGGFYHVAWPLGGGMLFGIHSHSATDTGDQFSEYHPGLDHVGFACASRGELEQWQSRLEELGIAHSGIEEAPYGMGLAFRDPDNIALEFFAPPG